MDMYKKKPLKFSGMGRDIRNAELNASRRSSRLQRFSLLRSLDDVEEEIPKENVPSSSRIPMLGNQKIQALSRTEMLKKWKNERMLKKKFEEQSKKPVFKVGVSSKLQSNPASFNKFNRLGDLSKIQESCIQSFSKPQTTYTSFSKSNLSKNPSSTKIAGGVKSKDNDSKFITLRSPSSSINHQINKSKGIFKPPIARSQVVNTLPQANKFKTDNVASRNLKLQVTARPIQNDIKSKDSINFGNQKPSKVAATTTTTANAKGSKKVPYSGLPKPATSMLPQQRQLNMPSGLNKPAIKISNSGPAKKIGTVLEKPKFGMAQPKKEIQKQKFGMAQPKKEMEKQKFGMTQPKKEMEKQKFGMAQHKKEMEKQKFGMGQPKKVVEKTKSEMVPPMKVEKIGLGKVQPKKETVKTELETMQSTEVGNFASESNHSPMFPCHLSLIEPVEARKSFAPEGFVFRPPIELETLWYLDNGPCAIFARLKDDLDENIRTSTPKRTEWSESEEQLDGSSIQKIPSTVETSNKSNKSTESVSSPEIKFAEPLLLNSFLEVELPVLKFSQNEESEQILKQPLEESTEKILPEINCLEETKQSKPISLETVSLNIFHPNRNGSENINDIEPFFQASNATSALDLPQKDQIKAKSDPCLIETDQATSTFSSNMANILEEEDETGSLSDSVFISQSDSNATKSKKFTWSCRQSKKPSLLKISESPEIKKTPKRVGTLKAQQKATLGEITPRRSMRIAKRNQVNLEECLFDVKESFYDSHEKDSSKLTYDFDKLHLESGDISRETLHPKSTSNNKISLLYTPTCTRSSSRLKSYGGDLMGFSPDV